MWFNFETLLSFKMKWRCSSDADTETGCEPRYIFIQLAAPQPFFLGVIARKQQKQGDLKCSLTQDRTTSDPRKTTWTQTGREQSSHRNTSFVQGYIPLEPRERENDTFKISSRILLRNPWRQVESKKSFKCFLCLKDVFLVACCTSWSTELASE